MDLTSNQFAWNWSDFCPTGLQPFASNSSNDLLPCFQEIVLQFPIYTIFAALSAYHFGSYTFDVSRNALQKRLLHCRVLISILLAALPVFKIFFYRKMGIDLYASDVLLVCTECLMWVVHSGESNI